jgi:hypothetical protein
MFCAHDNDTIDSTTTMNVADLIVICSYVHTFLIDESVEQPRGQKNIRLATNIISARQRVQLYMVWQKTAYMMNMWMYGLGRLGGMRKYRCLCLLNDNLVSLHRAIILLHNMQMISTIHK